MKQTFETKLQNYVTNEVLNGVRELLYEEQQRVNNKENDSKFNIENFPDVDLSYVCRPIHTFCSTMNKLEGTEQKVKTLFKKLLSKFTDEELNFTSMLLDEEETLKQHMKHQYNFWFEFNT